MAAAQPNIILVFSDQHRRDWMGYAGCSFVATPHLDALAARGTRFTNAYCSAPLCGPSRMSLLTGRHPWRNSIYINEDCLDPNTPTLPQALAQAGYETVLCGRMHFMGLDQRHGYQARLVGDICRTLPRGPDADYGALAGSSSSVRKAVTLAGPGDSPVLQYDEDVTRACERFLAAQRGDQPLFLTVGWYGPHHPYIAPHALYERARLAMQGRDIPIPRDPDPLHPWVQSRLEQQQVTEIDHERLAAVRASYAAMIDLMDQRIGRVLAAARALPGETIVVYLSDHGEMAGDHLLFGKGCFYEASAGVPLLIAPLRDDAAGVAAGAAIDVPASLLDVAPTLVRLAGAPPMPLTDGHDLGPLFAAPERARSADWAHRPVFAELKIGPNPPMRMVRRGAFKLCYYHGCAPTLFDLAHDPCEQRDVCHEPRHAALRDELLALALRDWDPARIGADAARKLADFLYGGGWGRHDDAQWSELWNPAQPVYEFGRVGEPLSWL